MKRLLRAAILLAAVAFYSGCKDTGTGSELIDASSLDGFNAKVAYSDATLEQLTPYLTDCQGGKLCVTICHRPPGNPTNSKTKILPLEAANAHLNHGGPHQDRDYLGACHLDDEGGGEEEPGEENPGEEEPGSGGGGEIPAWCLPFIDYDSNCDGFEDETGEPMF